MKFGIKSLRGIIAVMVVLLLAGCSSSSSSVTPQPPVPTETIAGQDIIGEIPVSSRQDITLGFSQLGSESDWRLANTESIQEAAKEAGIKLLFDNAEQSQEKQIEAIRGFIEQKVDVIAIAPVVQSGWEPIMKEAKQAGIPLILSDRSVDVNDPSLYVTFIGSDFTEEGRKAGKYLLDKMRDEVGSIGIVELKGTEGSSPSIERGKGFREIMAKREDFKILKSEYANFTQKEGKEVMKSFLEDKGRDIRVLFAHNDDMALGAIEAIEEYGLVPGKDIIIISVDGTRKAFEMMAEGKINCVVECNPLLGPNLMQAVKELIAGRTLPKRIVTPESVFTEEMAEREAANRKY
ncbi:ABC transporter substrate-binding protein [Cohnella cholangitidis]|uniref:ABC transporter substrate-binding protein n=1 Tax=Cohnella cholangitidis TaxID=2598458 RepID=A0A7G5C1V7_9BACL|nr:ABC transporter substrate-binding protein [Cohnella cholangitidis]QMV43191.1 ABC transporter substrate-binding protein [Cohnella cholangitidis]